MHLKPKLKRVGNKVAHPTLALPNDPRSYLVDMKKVIGTNGETKLRIVVETKGSNKITTAYPQK